MELGGKSFSLFIPETAICKRIRELGKEISENLAGKDPIFIVILNGAFLFASDLIKEIDTPCQLSFIKVASYSGTESSGEIKHLIGLNEPLHNRHIVVMDDIIDTGLTMKIVLGKIGLLGPASISVASLLLKENSFGKQFEVDYTGFTIPNHFVVGYGLDLDGYGRNLKDIYKLDL